MIQKNVSGQGVYLYAHDMSNDVPATGDAANMTVTISQDGAPAGAAAGVPGEIGGGVYWLPLTQAETNCDALMVLASSSSAGVFVDPLLVMTVAPAAFQADISGLSTFDPLVDSVNVGSVAGVAVSGPGDLKADVTNLDAAVSSRAAPADIPSAAAVSGAVWDEPLAGHQTAGSTGEALSASGGGATPSSVAAAVWDEAAAGHTTAGSMGAKLAAVPTPAAGAVAYTYTVTDGSSPLDGAEVWICTDAAGSNVIWAGATDAAGIARDANDTLPYLDPGSYYVFVQKSGYVFGNPTAIVAG